MFVPLWLLFVLALGEGGARVVAWAISRNESAVPAPQAGANIVYCIGDSFTYGFGVERDQSYPAMLQRLFDASGDSRRVQVLNWGNPGLSSSNAIWAVARALEKGNVALIVVLAGWNVNNSDFIRHAEQTDRSVPLVSRLDAVCGHSALYRLARQALTVRARTAVLSGVELVPQAPEVDLFNFRQYQEIAYENLTRIARMCREFDVPLVLLNYPYCDLPPNPYSKNEYYHVLMGRTPLTDEDYIIFDRRQDEIGIHSVVRRVGQEQRVPVIDLHETFLRSGRSDLFQQDYHHPTADGYALMAQAIFDVVGPDLHTAPVRLASLMEASN